METYIMILSFFLIVLTMCVLIINCSSETNRFLIRDLKKEIDELKERERINNDFADKLYDSTIDCTERIDALGKRITSLKHTIETGAHYDGYRPKYCNGTTCINPFRDCVGCPRMFGGGKNMTTTDSTQFKKE